MTDQQGMVIRSIWMSQILLANRQNPLSLRVQTSLPLSTESEKCYIKIEMNDAKCVRITQEYAMFIGAGCLRDGYVLGAAVARIGLLSPRRRVPRSCCSESGIFGGWCEALLTVVGGAGSPSIVVSVRCKFEKFSISLLHDVLICYIKPSQS
jgi:hypothetical protein